MEPGSSAQANHLGVDPRSDSSHVPARAAADDTRSGSSRPASCSPLTLPTNRVMPFVVSHPLPSARTLRARHSNASRRWDSRRGPGESGGTATAVVEDDSPPHTWAGQSLRERALPAPSTPSGTPQALLHQESLHFLMQICYKCIFNVK